MGAGYLIFQSNDAGQAVVLVTSSGTANVIGAVYDPTTGWSMPTTLDTDAASISGSRMSASIDAQGNAIAVWIQPTGVADVYWSRYSRVDNAWSTAQILNTDLTYAADSPSVGMDASGNALAVWSQRLPTTAQNAAVARAYTPTGGWGPLQRINPTEAGSTYVYKPMVRVSADGTGMAIWGQNNGTISNFWGARYVPNSGWESDILIENSTETSQSELDLTASSDGRFMALLTTDPGVGTVNTMVNLFTPSSPWTAATSSLIETFNPGYAYPVDGSGVFTRDNQVVHAFWNQTFATVGNLYRLMWSYNDGTGWKTARAIGPDMTSGAIPYSDAAADSYDRVIAIWISETGLASSVYAPGTDQWEEPKTVATFGGGASLPKIMVNDCGDATAFWISGGSLYTANYR
jgi:hypothetical protein